MKRSNQAGNVGVVLALVMPVILLAVAGSVATYSIFASHRELQRAADQAALAGAISMPLVDPGQLVETAPFPLPNTNPVYDLLPVKIPRMGDLINDPRSVACKFGSDGLSKSSAPLASAIENPSAFQTPLDKTGRPLTTQCADTRIYPSMSPNPGSDTAAECADRLVEKVAAENKLPPPLPARVSVIQQSVNSLVRLDLNRMLPAALTPRFHVDVHSYLEPPLLSVFTNSSGRQIKAGATAYRRIKNAVIVPIVPAKLVPIELGVLTPQQVITDPVNLNGALNRTQAPLLAAVTDADNRINSVMDRFGLPCHNLLFNLRRDLADIYNPPTSPAPTAKEIVDAAITAAANTAARTGIPQPDPSNPNSLAGEAFVLIGVAVDQFYNPVSALQIPIVDAALVAIRKQTPGNYSASVIAAANAQGVFRATLVD